MSGGYVLPSSPEAERALLGCLLIGTPAAEDVYAMVTASDFYVPRHQTLYDTIHQLHLAGRPTDAVMVATELQQHDLYEDIGGPATLLDLQSETPAVTRALFYAEQIVRTSRLRAIVSFAADINEGAHNPGADPDALFDALALAAGDRRLQPRIVSVPDDFVSVKDFIDEYAKRHPDDDAEWVVPGLLKRRHRVMFVAGEGSAKSMILRQIVTCAANGIHPFGGVPIPPKRGLIIDCENPADIIVEQTGIIDDATGLAMSESENLWVWSRDRGIDLRTSRVNRVELEAILQEVRPDIVAMGPVYKLYSSLRDDAEGCATQFLWYLDGLRARFGFALLMEHHAPRGATHVRDLVPYGTVIWQRWPEFGIKLKPEDIDSLGHPHTLRLGTFRGARTAKATWPTLLSRDSKSMRLPWAGTYEDGYWNQNVPNSEQRPPPPDSEPF